ncbi:hypothetical protein PHLGIDRAFT_44322, partial [Phlebiopsis gigantea 11061_1 CR5-6]
LPDFPAGFAGQYTAPPNPTWTFGQKVEATPEGRAFMEGEKQGWTTVNAEEQSPAYYQLMISGIAPRPIGMVSSVSESGVENLAVFSWFNMVSHDPPVVSLSMSDVGERFKDTVANIRATKEFVVNTVSTPFIQNANVTAIDTPPDVSEWDISGLTKVPSLSVKPPRVKESVFSMECELFQAVDIVVPETGRHTTTLVLGRVKRLHVRNDALITRHSASADATAHTVDITKTQYAARIGDISYTAVGPFFRIPRASWAGDREKV